MSAAVFQLAKLSALTHLLNPSVFGLMAIVMVVIGFSQAFLDMGISNAIIHKQDVTQEQLSTLYWFNIIAGILIFFILCGVAPFVARFYNEPELAKLIILTGTTFFIQPVGQQFMILWQKEMRFSRIAKIDIFNSFVSLIVTVWLAYLGYGIYALVYGVIVAALMKTVLYLILGLREYKPQMTFRPGNVVEFLSFGAYQMGERTINYFNYQIDTILIGRLLGMEALGIYNIAKQLVMKPAQLFNPIITKVTFPAMAKIQNDTARLKYIYLKTINSLSSINFPIYAFIIIFADDLVGLLFGNKWYAAVPIVQILSFWAALRSTGNPIGSLLLAKGKANWGFWWNLALLVYIPFGIYISSKWGLEGIGFGLILMQLFLMPSGWYFLVKPLCGAKFTEYHINIFKPAIIVLSAYLISMAVIDMTENNILRFIIGTLTETTIVVILYIKLNKDFMADLMEIIK